MRQETFAILFLMRKGRPKKNGLAPIFARITTGGLRQEVYTQCDSNPETWNQHKERAMGTNKLAIQVNERLNDFRVKIIDIRTKLLAEGYAANAAQIKQRYLNPTCNTMMLIAGLADYAKRRQGEDRSGRAHHAAHGRQVRTAAALPETVSRPARQGRGHPCRADELRVSGRLQPLPANRPPLPPQRSGRRDELSAQLCPLLPAQRVDHEKSVPLL